MNRGLAEEQEKQNELKRKDGRMLQEDGWKCICGQLNASYVGTCSCGRTRADVEDIKKKKNRAGEIKKQMLSLKEKLS